MTVAFTMRLSVESRVRNSMRLTRVDQSRADRRGRARLPASLQLVVGQNFGH